MSRIYRKLSSSGIKITSGWWYEYQNDVSGPYDTQKQAENALMVRLLDAKPQRGRSTSNNR